MSESSGEAQKPSEYAETPLEFWQLMEAERRRDETDYIEFSSSPNYETALREVFQDYESRESFVPGQLVQWKPRMKNQRFPLYGKPAVVMKMIDTDAPLDFTIDGGTEARDIVLGFLDGDGDLRTYAYSSLRFTNWDS
ncbi:hypothetical protein [Microcella sp.]|uniref:hypothetical protein n=1 Tax=Microcella sp. TaxID=1913979 RepID=UPI003F6E9DC3